jgi:hypothetical protein
VPAAHWHNGCWPTVSMWSTCRQKLSARARLFDTGHNRKTDAHDAHAVAAVAVRTTGLRVLAYDDELESLRMPADRRKGLSPDNASRL